MSDEIPTLWSANDIAGYLQIKRKTVLNRTQYETGFPKPVKGSKRPLLWRRDQVLAFVLS